ncbi:AAA family ATPase [Oscillospiraceae bacterium HCP3S3_F4]
MENKKEMTALDVSAATDTEQPISKCTDNSISEKAGKINDLETISMTELYDTVYPSKPPLIDGLLYTGTYLFVGAPKLGKSYLMAQLAYHISTGTPLWDYTVRKGTVLYLALEDDYRRLQERLYRMFGTDSTDNLFFSVSADSLGNGLDAQLQRFIIDEIQMICEKTEALLLQGMSESEQNLFMDFLIQAGRNITSELHIERKGEEFND